MLCHVMLCHMKAAVDDAHGLRAEPGLPLEEDLGLGEAIEPLYHIMLD